MEKHVLCYGEHNIEFTLYRKNVKNINLNIKPDLSIVVSVNETVPLDFVMSYVRKKVPWILKTMSYFGSALSETTGGKEYINGETFKFLGKQIRLKVQLAEGESVRYSKSFLHLSVKNPDDYNRKKRLVDRWFREKAVSNFDESLDRIYPLVAQHGIMKPILMIRVMKARWGSCIKDRNIILLNYELVKAPKYCLDYVVLHELIHFLYRNHDTRFYNFLSAIMPDWKERKRILDEEVVRSL